MLIHIQANYGIVSIDDRGAILNASKAALHMFGYESDPNSMLNQNVSILMPSPYKDFHDSYIARYHSTGNTSFIGEFNFFTVVDKSLQIFLYCYYYMFRQESQFHFTSSASQW
jgi:PAS domain S-box-containing protein